MVQQLTKEKLLERVLALEDGTVIEGSLQEILMSPYDSPAMIDTIKAMHRFAGVPDEKSLAISYMLIKRTKLEMIWLNGILNLEKM